jgi:hypothetical protein
MRRPTVDRNLAKLVGEACARPMSAAARERQLVSLAYGNAKIENDRVTRSQVEQALCAEPKRR